ncbi:hypothetical protein [Microbacterium sp.]|uniref:hypothetical protein n=1 Tax=Microbacterium sp. TaxID=51671 RepID=UPI00260BE137|nr:hypothetical protein [Microbacterium sp.]
MEQRPAPGQQPLDPPTADVAQVYLDEIEQVRDRREKHIDRRRLAWFSLTDAVALSIYITIAAFAIGTPPGVSFLVLIAAFLVWLHLALERREGDGTYGTPLSGERSVAVWFAILLILVVVGGVVLGSFGLRPPWTVRLVPGLLALAVFGVPAVRQLQQSMPLSQALRPLSSGERWMSVGVGVFFAVGAGVVMAEFDELRVPIVGAAMCGCVVVWWIAARISDRLPVLGAVWSRSQWGAFGIGAVALAAAILVRLVAPSAPLAVFAPWVGSGIVLLFAAAVFRDGRDG